MIMLLLKLQYDGDAHEFKLKRLSMCLTSAVRVHAQPLIAAHSVAASANGLCCGDITLKLTLTSDGINMIPYAVAAVWAYSDPLRLCSGN